MRQAVARVVVLLLVLASAGCVSTEQSGYAARARAETDALAAEALPALVTGLGARVHLGTVGFVRCDVRGWRYRAEGDLFGTDPDPAAQVDAVAAVLATAGLEVERRADGSAIGRRGELSLLVGAPLGPPERPFRHYTLTHACAAYSDDDEAYAGSTDASDYTAYVPQGSLYTP